MEVKQHLQLVFLKSGPTTHTGPARIIIIWKIKCFWNRFWRFAEQKLPRMITIQDTTATRRRTVLQRRKVSEHLVHVLVGRQRNMGFHFINTINCGILPIAQMRRHSTALVRQVSARLSYRVTAGRSFSQEILLYNANGILNRFMRGICSQSRRRLQRALPF